MTDYTELQKAFIKQWKRLGLTEPEAECVVRGYNVNAIEEAVGTSNRELVGQAVTAYGDVSLNRLPESSDETDLSILGTPKTPDREC